MSSKNVFIIFSVLTMFLIVSCKEDRSKLFTKLSESNTGITFRNLLQEDHPEFNIITYPYFYNGGGVAVGDINNDGLPDVCFTGNMVRNRLYLNKGNFKFEDITDKAGVAAKEGWCTGVTMADVNGDGNLDIYICRSGLENLHYRPNLLFINNGDLTFTEEAHQYGLDDAGYSTQASFFYYDKDGDLDMMLINQSSPEYSKGKIEYLQLRNEEADSTLSNKLFRNDAGHFIDISKQAGIHSNRLSFSLGLSTADLNNDGWPDIYISNDFKEPDYFYINNKDGTFSEQLAQHFSHTSLYGMGIDIADYNNDDLPDLVQLDMLPESSREQKMHMGADGFDQYNPLFQRGMPYQYMKNSLQKNNGDGTFSEIGQLAGMSNTDWSWAPLFCDFNNDGKKDLFITNGYKRDYTDIQFIKYSNERALKIQAGQQVADVSEYMAKMPTVKIDNYIYENEAEDAFLNKIKGWGLDDPSITNGAVYVDLDNDGDMDLITNNLDDYAGVFRNNSETIDKNNFLKIKLLGGAKNSLGYGAKVYVMNSGKSFYQEENPVRGFCSSVDPLLNFGLGKVSSVDSVVVVWNDNQKQVLRNIKPNQTLAIKQSNANETWLQTGDNGRPYFSRDTAVIDFTHVENDFNDFSVQTLLPSYLSRQGPCMAIADVNKDGRQDVFIGGAKGQPSQLFLQDVNKKFIHKPQLAFVKDALCEDVAAVFFDANGDGYPDLYVGSGGYEFAADDSALQDRIYINDGKGGFARKTNALPLMFISTGCVKAADINGDGYADLFAGGRCVPGKYPATTESKILLNNGKGDFTDATQSICPALQNAGMITSAVWVDLNKDGKEDLIIAGEWISPEVFLNERGKLVNATSAYIKFAANGWWNAIYADDFDRDGDTDLVLGNQGLNNQFRANEQEPMTLYCRDFDGNGTIDPFMFYYVGDTSYPAYSRDDIVQQVPSFNKKYLYYTDFANATIDNMFTKEQLNNAAVLKTNNLRTVYLENTGKEFIEKQLPVEVQYAPVYAISSADINHDAKQDIILSGNNTWTRIKFSRYDASHAMLLLGDGKGNFTYVPQWKSGLNVQGNVRSIEKIDNQFIFGINNSKAMSYKFK
jgi:hypothetical protein